MKARLIRSLRCCLGFIEANGRRGHSVCGRYEPQNLNERMAGVDVVVMGSTWYENAPMVIQEAFLHARPVLAPNFGGMSEKVQDGHSGLLFARGNAVDLSSVIRRCCEEPNLVRQLQSNVQSLQLLGNRVLDQHRSIYRKFRSEPHSNLCQVNLDDILLEDLRSNFEPLGANCELGFLMSRLGIDRSSLFRWLFTPLASLELVLHDKLQNFFSEPCPVTDPVMGGDMVVDRRTGVFFHAGDLRFVLEQAVIKDVDFSEIYASNLFKDQLGKYRYLVEKFLASVSDPLTLHVFSDFHGELTQASMLRIHSALQAMGKPVGSTLLFVRACGPGDVANQVRSMGDGIHLATIRRLAQGEHADRIDLQAWVDVLRRSRQLS